MSTIESLILRRKLWYDRWVHRDMYYEYSDDHSAYVKGKNELQQLLKEDQDLRDEERLHGLDTHFTGECDDIHR
jgi:hypothetical protein